MASGSKVHKPCHKINETESVSSRIEERSEPNGIEDRKRAETKVLKDERELRRITCVFGKPAELVQKASSNSRFKDDKR